MIPLPTSNARIAPFFPEAHGLLREESIIQALSPYVDNTVMQENYQESYQENYQKNYQDKSYNLSAKSLIARARTIPQVELNAVLEVFPSFLDDTMTKTDKINLLDRILQIPQIEREDICSLFNSTMKGNDKLKLLQNIPYYLPENQLLEVVRLTRPLLANGMLWSDVLYLLGLINSISQRNRTSLIQQVFPHLNNTLSVYVKMTILKTISEIPQPIESTRKILPLLTVNMTARNIMALARYVDILPEAVVHDATLLLALGQYFSVDSIIELLHKVHQIPKVGRTSLIQDSIPLITQSQDRSWNQVYSVLTIMSRIPQGERAELIQDAMPLLNIMTMSSTRADSLWTLSLIAKEQRNAFLQELLPVFHTLQIHGGTSFIFYLLPDSLKTQERLSCVVEGIFKDPEYRSALIDSLEQKFLDDKSSPALLFTMADFVNSFAEALSIHEEHPVMQHTIEILSSYAVVGEKNPFSLYKQLQLLAKEPIDFHSPIYEVARHSIAFRLDQLQLSGKAFSIAREDLPQDATKEAWHQLTNDLKQKVELNPTAHEQIEKMGTTWKELWEGCFSAPYIIGLLKTLRENVPFVEAQFRALLHHLLAKDKTVKAGEFFSEQETLLIMQGMSIQKCEGGKKEGIALVYNLLDPAFKYPAKGLEEADLDKRCAKEFITDVVQKAISDQFSGSNRLMQELTGVQSIEQISHQALYLKNLIGQLVGLRHEVVFDRYSGLLYDSLVATSREEALRIFFCHFTPQLLVRELMRVINNDFRKNLNIVRHIVSEFDGWHYDEETDAFTEIKESGALQLLQTAGFLT